MFMMALLLVQLRGRSFCGSVKIGRKAVIKARQDAASKESASVVENIFFSADSYPSQKEKQWRLDEVSLAIDFERIESSFSETHEVYASEKERSKDDDASKPVHVDQHLHIENKRMILQ